MMVKGFLAGCVVAAFIGAGVSIEIQAAFSKPRQEPLPKMILPPRPGAENVPAFQGGVLPQSIYPGCGKVCESDCLSAPAGNQPVAM